MISCRGGSGDPLQRSDRLRGAEIRLDTEDTLNDRRGAVLDICFAPGGRVWNIGYTGVPQEAGKAYNFYMFAKVDKPLKLRIAVEDGDKVVDEACFALTGSGFIRYDATLIASATTGSGRFVLSGAFCQEPGQQREGRIQSPPAP